MKLLKKEVFDINKVTVVGSPTITSDGVASGFSSSNLIYKDVDLDNKSFVIETPVFHYSQASSTDQYMINIGTYNNKLLIQARVLASGKISIGVRNDSTDIVADSSITAVLNNKYQIKFVLNTSVAEIYLKTNDGDYVLVKSVPNSNLYEFNIKRLFVGIPYIGSTSFFLGSIDLPSFKVFVDGKEVYNTLKPTYLMEKRKPMVWDKEQFTIVGNPSISDSGVASGFSDGNYINTKLIGNLSSGYFKIILSNLVLKTTVASIPIFQIRGQELFTVKNSINIAENYNSYKVFVYDDSYTLLQDLKTDNVSTNLTPKEIIFEAQGETAKLTVNYDSGNPLVINNIDMSGFNYSALQTAYCSLGKTNWAHSEYIEKLNLTDFSVKTNNKEVFTGAKVNYYAMR